MSETKPVVICAIAKNEHLYINDWVKYHIDLGFDHIYIFDNDDKTSRFMGEYIDIGYADKVSFFDVREQKSQWFQQNCYNWFYQNYNQTFDWCAFIDIDEFIVVNKWNNIKEMLIDNRFAKFSSIKICWRVYGDDNYIKRDIRIPVFSFFKKQLLDSPLKAHAKQITRGSLSGAEIHNHNCFLNGKITGQCTVDGVLCFEENGGVNINGEYLFDDCYINHYMTKTLDEFLVQKFGRGDAMFASRSIGIDYFWRVNTPTDDKLLYIQNNPHGHKSEITILVVSCDKNADLFDPFYKCMEKYWPNHPRIIYSTETIKNPYYDTISLNYDFSNWSKRVKETVESIDSNFILLMVDDIFLHENVNNRLIESLPYMFNDNTAAINFEHRFDINDKIKNGLVSIRSKNGKYKTSMMCQLWDKSKLLTVFPDKGNPWDVETANLHNGYEYLISNQGDFLNWGKKYGGDWRDWGLFRGKWAPSMKDFFDKEKIIIDFSKRGFYK